MIAYDEHAEFQIARRGIEKAWVEEAIVNPDHVETSGMRRSFLKCLAGRRVMLACRDAAGRSDFCDHSLFRQDQTMRVRVDQGADAVYLRLAETAVKESEEVSAGIVLDFDAEGRVVGIEILDASKRAGNPAALKDFSFELPGAA